MPLPKPLIAHWIGKQFPHLDMNDLKLKMEKDVGIWITYVNENDNIVNVYQRLRQKLLTVFACMKHQKATSIHPSPLFYQPAIKKDCLSGVSVLVRTLQTILQEQLQIEELLCIRCVRII